MSAILTICLLSGACVVLAHGVYKAPSALSVLLGGAAVALLLLAGTSPLVMLLAGVTGVASGVRARRKDAVEARHRAGREFI